MAWLVVVVLAVLVIAGCAIAIGNSTASVSTHGEVRREVTKDTPVIEDVLTMKEKRK